MSNYLGQLANQTKNQGCHRISDLVSGFFDNYPIVKVFEDPPAHDIQWVAITLRDLKVIASTFNEIFNRSSSFFDNKAAPSDGRRNDTKLMIGALKDINTLGAGFHEVANHDFTAERFESHQHLLLGRVVGDESRCILGIPDLYCKHCAVKAGEIFCTFKMKNPGDLIDGASGYWLKMLG